MRTSIVLFAAILVIASMLCLLAGKEGYASSTTAADCERLVAKPYDTNISNTLTQAPQGTTIYERINHYRQQHGLAPYTADQTIIDASASDNARMACAFEHNYSDKYFEGLAMLYNNQPDTVAIDNFYEEVKCFDVANQRGKEGCYFGNERGVTCVVGNNKCYGHAKDLLSKRHTRVGCAACLQSDNRRKIVRCKYQ